MAHLVAASRVDMAWLSQLGEILVLTYVWSSWPSTLSVMGGHFPSMCPVELCFEVPVVPIWGLRLAGIACQDPSVGQQAPQGMHEDGFLRGVQPP